MVVSLCILQPNKKKNGKLRIVYELNPMSFIVEAAGGRATTGSERILDIKPLSIHARAPAFLGSKQDVEEIDAMYKAHNSQKEESKENN